MKEDIKFIKKINRENQLEREKLVGRPRAKSWDGKKSVKQDRKDTKSKLRNHEDKDPH